MLQRGRFVPLSFLVDDRNGDPSIAIGPVHLVVKETDVLQEVQVLLLAHRDGTLIGGPVGNLSPARSVGCDVRASPGWSVPLLASSVHAAIGIIFFRPTIDLLVRHGELIGDQGITTAIQDRLLHRVEINMVMTTVIG